MISILYLNVSACSVHVYAGFTGTHLGPSSFATDVDTDLYKLIMSPQYLTTEHIQVMLCCLVLMPVLRALFGAYILSFISYLDISLPNGSWLALCSFVIGHSSRFGKCRE